MPNPQLKTIIEKILKEEIKGILDDAREEIRTTVKKALLPELKSAVQKEIHHALNELLAREEKTDSSSELKKTAENSTTDSGFFQSKSVTNPVQSALYLYAIADGYHEIELGSMGIDGNNVYTIACGDFTAIVHDCTAQPYQSEDEKKVKNWVSTHQKVVDKAWEEFGNIIPLGFDTLIVKKDARDPKESLKQWIEGDYSNLVIKMDKIRDKAEYGIQVFWEAKPMALKVSRESDEIIQLQNEIKSKPRGVAYMYRQKLEELLKSEMARSADHYFQQFYEKIAPYADDLQVEKTKKPENDERQMLLNLSLLLPKDRSGKLGEALEEIEALEGFSVRFTGPWPPYSFV